MHINLLTTSADVTTVTVSTGTSTSLSMMLLHVLLCSNDGNVAVVLNSVIQTVADPEGERKQKNGQISAEIWSKMRHLRHQISQFTGRACPRTPLDHISAS